MAQEDVLIKFEVDYTELDNAISALEKTGKLDPKTAAQFNQTSKAITNVGADTAELIKTFKDVASASVKMGKTVENAFGAGVQDALDDAGVSVEEFGAALKKANAPAVSLKKELMQLKEQMARLKAAGKDTGTEFDTLRKKAGALSDAIADTNAEIKNAGSDTRGLDNVLGSVTALAGGYSAIQGATALFGEENEDLQKALLKVNGAMAIAQGLQVVYNATLKEGALTKLADSIATGAQTAATTLYTFVMGGATVATKVFRAALVATGIGAIVILIVSLVSAMSDYGDETKEAKEAQDQLRSSVELMNDSLDFQISRLKRLGEERVAQLQSQGKTEAEISKERVKLINDEIELLKQKEANSSRLADSEEVGSLEAQRLYKEANDFFYQQEALKSQIKIIGFNEDNKRREEQLKKEKEWRDKQKKALEDAAKEAARQENETAKNSIQTAIDKVNKELDQEYIKYNNIADLDAESYERKLARLKKFQVDSAAIITEGVDFGISEGIRAAKEDERLAKEKEERFKKNTAQLVDIGNQVSQIYAQIADSQKKADDDFIKSQREKIDAELKAGVITSKEADARQKRVDQLERNAKNKAAKREKAVAVFNAALGIPTAFIKGLNSGGIQLAVVYAALAAVQAAIVAARPVPQFFRGKKDKYQGPGIVADMGSELVERGGRMFLYTKPTQTYLGANDKVYTAAETRQIMHNTNISTTVVKDRPERFDYDRFAKAIPAAGINISIDRDGITKWGDAQRSRETYLTRKWRNKP